MNDSNDRAEYNRMLNNIKRLILSGFSDESFSVIQNQMAMIRNFTVPEHYNKLGSFVRDSYTDTCDIKGLNQLVRDMRLNDK